MSSLVIIQQMTIIFILLASGFVVTKLKLISGEISGEISRIVLYVCSPSLMISSAFKADSSISKVLLVQAMILGAIMYVSLLFFAELLPRIIRTEKKLYTNYRMMTVFSNVGFIGIPVVNAVLGPDGVIFTIVFNIYYNILFYTYGFLIVRKQSAPGEKIELPIKDMVNIGTISSMSALLIYLLRVPLPYIISESAAYLGQSTTFLSLFVIGINLSKSSFREIFGDKRLYVFVFFRQLVLPILFGLAIRPFISSELLFLVTVIMASMPIGSMPMMLAEKEGQDSSLYARGVIISTVLSVITIPIVLICV